ncbi:MAG: hypothetical protein JKY54_00985 [Flavobacteriales bacterium]|nr:hypothetical protein [Flavobacteriales bacterium]
MIGRASRRREYMEMLPHRLLDMEYKGRITSFQKIVVTDFAQKGRTKGEIENRLQEILKLNERGNSIKN